ncbi:MAG: tryptophan synthase subunit alpha [Balneolaceae bacterium]|nr:tryptophan synthase subunit alpha [Balneolaceae bacterium]
MIETGNKNRINRLFNERDNASKVMSLFLTAGYPEIESTVELILGFEENGAELIELGMPFSDPLADGPTIQYSSEIAIKNGITVDRIFKMVEEIREQSQIPLILMGYMNPVLRYGIEDFCERAARAGADGLIIPDIPPEESGLIEQQADNNGLALIYLVAPNTSDRRMKMIDSKSNGFVYCVSVTGVTGAREGDEVARSVERFIDRVNEHVTANPKLIGFGIKSHEDAARIAAKADGFIVGSALIDTIRDHYPDKGWKDKIFEFVRTLKYGNHS